MLKEKNILKVCDVNILTLINISDDLL